MKKVFLVVLLNIASLYANDNVRISIRAGRIGVYLDIAKTDFSGPSDLSDDIDSSVKAVHSNPRSGLPMKITCRYKSMTREVYFTREEELKTAAKQIIAQAQGLFTEIDRPKE